MKLLVTGATGQLGSRVVETLLKTVPASQLVVSVRNPEKAEELRALGVEVRYGDFEKPETLETAFSGIDRLLIISADHAKNAVAAAQRAGVKFIVYTSAANAGESDFILAPPHRAVEKAILETGIPYSFLRNNWYLENEIESIKGVMAGAPWVTSIGEGKIGWALRQDFAEAAANVLSGEGHENTIYELSGNLMTQDELISVLGTVLEKEVLLQQVDVSTYSNMLKGIGMPEERISLLVNIQKDLQNGALEIESNDFEKLLGRPTTPIKEALSQIVKQNAQMNN